VPLISGDVGWRPPVREPQCLLHERPRFLDLLRSPDSPVSHHHAQHSLRLLHCSMGLDGDEFGAQRDIFLVSSLDQVYSLAYLRSGHFSPTHLLGTDRPRAAVHADTVVPPHHTRPPVLPDIVLHSLRPNSLLPQHCLASLRRHSKAPHISQKETLWHQQILRPHKGTVKVIWVRSRAQCPMRYSFQKNYLKICVFAQRNKKDVESADVTFECALCDCTVNSVEMGRAQMQ